MIYIVISIEHTILWSLFFFLWPFTWFWGGYSLILLASCICFSLLVSLDLEEPYEDMCSPLVEDVIHDEEIIRQAAAEALAATLNHHREYVTPIIDQLLQKYEEKYQVRNTGWLRNFGVENVLKRSKILFLDIFAHHRLRLNSTSESFIWHSRDSQGLEVPVSREVSLDWICRLIYVYWAHVFQESCCCVVA